VNDYDYSMVTGTPGVYRLFFGLFKPKRPIPGMELSGIVEAVGTKVTGFKVGQEVYGDTSDYGFGTMAEYVCVHEKGLVRKPDFLSHEQAAALSHAGNLAWQSLMDIGELKSGMKILINGAGGGVGTIGLLIAKTFDVHVTGVDAGTKLNKMRELGFDVVLDYKKTDFTATGEKYDLILDAKSTRSPKDYMKALNPGALYVTVGGHVSKLLRLLFARLFGNKQMRILALKTNKDNKALHDLMKSASDKLVLDGPYTLEEAPAAISRFGDGLHVGKVIIKP